MTEPTKQTKNSAPKLIVVCHHHITSYQERSALHVYEKRVWKHREKKWEYEVAREDGGESLCVCVCGDIVFYKLRSKSETAIEHNITIYLMAKYLKIYHLCIYIYKSRLDQKTEPSIKWSRVELSQAIFGWIPYTVYRNSYDRVDLFIFKECVAFSHFSRGITHIWSSSSNANQPTTTTTTKIVVLSMF